MIRLLLVVFIFSASLATAQVFPEFGGERTGISIAAALKIGVGARSAGMGETFVAIADDASALYWNPAGITQFKTNQALFGYTRWLNGLTHQSAQGVYHLDEANSLGVSMSILEIGSIPVTTEFQPRGTGETFRMQDVNVGLTYARQFTEQFSAGVTLHYVHEVLGKATVGGVLFDAGTYYRTGLGTSRFAVAVSNFGGKMTPSGSVPTVGALPDFNGGTQSSFQSFDPPINFRIGFAMEPINEETYHLTTSLQLNHPNDNAENYCFGAEYWTKFLGSFPAEVTARGGWKINAGEENLSFGAGAFLPIAEPLGLSIDYSYSNFKTLGGVHRLSAGLRF